MRRKILDWFKKDTDKIEDKRGDKMNALKLDTMKMIRFEKEKVMEKANLNLKPLTLKK